MTPLSILKHNDNSDKDIYDDKSGDPEEFTSSSDTEADNVNHKQQVLVLGQVHLDEALQNTMRPLRKKWSHADSAIVRPPLPNLHNPAGAIPPPLLKWQ